MLQAVDLRGPSQDVGIPGLSREAAHAICVPAAPPLDEQRRIADFLDAETARIDQLRMLREQQIKLILERSAAVVSSRYAELAREWGTVQIRHVMRRMEQGWSPECYNRPADDGEWGVLKAGCVNGGVFTEAQNKALPENVEPRLEYQIKLGDLLISRASGSPELIGSAALVTEVNQKLLLCDKIYRVILENGKADCQYVAYMLRSHSVRQEINSGISGAGGLANNIPSDIIKGLQIPAQSLPIQQEVKSEILRYDSQVAVQKNLLDRQLALLAERRQALITAAVTGQLDGTTARGGEVP